MTEKFDVGTAFEIPCGGATHRLLVTRRGAVVLLDHPDFRTEQALAVLGDGHRQPCLVMRGLFADFRSPHERSYGAVPWPPQRRDFDWYIGRNRSLVPLGDPIYAAALRRYERRQRRATAPGARQDGRRLSSRERWERRLESEAERALSQCCSYRYPFISGQGGGLNVRVSMDWEDEFPTIEGGLSEGGMMGGLWGCCVSVEIGASWSHVWRRGLAVIDRKFVLEIVKDRDPLIVRAGRQRRDFTVEPCLARVTRSGRLRWLDEAEEDDD